MKDRAFTLSVVRGARIPRPGVLVALAVLAMLVIPQSAIAQGSEGPLPNILILMGDDIGMFSAFGNPSPGTVR